MRNWWKGQTEKGRYNHLLNQVRKALRQSCERPLTRETFAKIRELAYWHGEMDTSLFVERLYRLPPSPGYCGQQWLSMNTLRNLLWWTRYIDRAYKSPVSCWRKICIDRLYRQSIVAGKYVSNDSHPPPGLVSPIIPNDIYHSQTMLSPIVSTKLCTPYLSYDDDDIHW